MSNRFILVKASSLLKGHPKILEDVLKQEGTSQGRIKAAKEKLQKDFKEHYPEKGPFDGHIQEDYPPKETFELGEKNAELFMLHIEDLFMSTYKGRGLFFDEYPLHSLSELTKYKRPCLFVNMQLNKKRKEIQTVYCSFENSLGNDVVWVRPKTFSLNSSDVPPVKFSFIGRRGLYLMEGNNYFDRKETLWILKEESDLPTMLITLG
jgi:hypothetical protein